MLRIWLVHRLQEILAHERETFERRSLMSMTEWLQLEEFLLPWSERMKEDD